MASISRRLVSRLGTSTVAASRWLLGSATARFLCSSAPHALNQLNTKPLDGTEDLPSEEYCSITLGAYQLRAPQVSLSRTIRLLVNLGTKGLCEAPDRIYRAQQSGSPETYEVKKVDEGLFVPGVGIDGLGRQKQVIYSCRWCQRV